MKENKSKYKFLYSGMWDNEKGKTDISVNHDNYLYANKLIHSLNELPVDDEKESSEKLIKDIIESRVDKD